MKEELAKIDGTILEALPNTMFKVELSDGRTILATLKGAQEPGAQKGPSGQHTYGKVRD